MKRYRYAVMVQEDNGPYECVLDTDDKYEAYECQDDYQFSIKASRVGFDVYIDTYEANEVSHEKI